MNRTQIQPPAKTGEDNSDIWIPIYLRALSPCNPFAYAIGNTTCTPSLEWISIALAEELPTVVTGAAVNETELVVRTAFDDPRFVSPLTMSDLLFLMILDLARSTFAALGEEVETSLVLSGTSPRDPEQRTAPNTNAISPSYSGVRTPLTPGPSPWPFLIYLPAFVAPAIMLYRRLTAERILRNPTRRAIFEEVRKVPGLGLRAIARSAGVHPTTAAEHLRVLQEFGAVERHHTASRDYFFENGGTYSREEIVRFIRMRGSRIRIMTLITSEPGLRLTDIAARLRLAKSTIHEQVRTLVADGLTRVERMNGREIRIYPDGSKRQKGDDARP